MMTARLFKNRTSIDAVKLLSVALAYFVCGRLGLALPSVDSHITLIWLPTGIAVAALLRWGYICWPGILLGALATNYSIDSSPLLDSCIALGNTAGPLLAAWMLQRLKFQRALDRARDILLLVSAAASGMLASASGGVISLRLFGVLPAQDIGLAWLSWWAGDVVGVLMAVPLLLNISRAELKKLSAQRAEFLAWTGLTLVLVWGVFFLNRDIGNGSLPLVFILLPLVVWAAMRFGIAGSSLALLLPAGVAAVATGLGAGPFHTQSASHGLIVLWLYLATLVVVNLMVAALQSTRKKVEESLNLDRDFNEALIQSLPGIFYVFDTSGRFLRWNKQLEKVLHCSSEEIARSHPLDFFSGTDRGLVEENIRKVFTDGETVVEAALVARNGVKIPYYFTGRRIQYNGEAVLVGMGIDVAERKQAEQQLVASELQLRTIFETGPECVKLVAEDGTLLQMNPAGLRMLEADTPEQVIGHEALGIVLPSYRKDFVALMRRVFAGESGHLEFEVTGLKGSRRWLETDEVPMRDAQGRITAMLGVTRDITSRKQIEQKSEVLMRRHQALMKSALEGIHIMDMRGNLVEFNDTFCQMLGYTREEAAKLNVADWDAQWSRDELMGRFKHLITVDGALFETRHRRKDGAVIDVEVSTTGADIEGEYYLYASSRDITARKKAEIELRDSERKSRMLMDSAADAVFVADPATESLLYINERFESALGYSRAELAGSNMFDLVTPAFRDVYRERFRGIVQSGGVTTREIRLNRKDGSSVSFEMNVVTLPDGTLYGACRDITERKRADEALRIAAVTFDTQEAIMITAPDGRILRVNKSFHDITGYGSDEVIGQNPRILQSGRHNEAFYQAMWTTLLDTGKWAGEIWDKRKDGSVYPKSMTITAVYNGQKQVSHYVAVFRDISNLKQSEQEIHQLAFYDALTRLPNRRLLLDRLQQAMATGSRSGRYGALLFLDLDHFKNINDTRGHAAGDELLVAVADRLRACVREGDSVARMGGDEFVVVLENLSSTENEAAALTESIAEKILGELDKPYVLSGFECLSTVSIGVSLFLGHQESAADLLQHTDVAMYQAKAQGRNAIRFFDPHMQTVLQARAALEADLRHALEKQQFRLQYQIQVDRLRRPLGAEVLLRWEHPQRGLIPPDEFIPLAEETGLIVPIGLWVLQTACAQLGKWQNDALTRDLTLAVNVSAKQFRQADFVAYVQRALRESGAKPARLKLELTESTVLDNVADTISKMHEINASGVSFSMDDFGTGYSSLQYLKLLPLDQIKIDQSFVRDIVTDPNDAAIVQTIIAMAETLGFDVIAEGVENEAQREFLDLRGCPAFQGYLFSRPVPIEQFEALLRQGI